MSILSQIPIINLVKYKLVGVLAKLIMLKYFQKDLRSFILVELQNKDF